MHGPAPLYRPNFPPDFVEQARKLVRQRTVGHHLWQRATLVLLLHKHPLVSNSTAATQVHLHPNSVRLWRRRWTHGDYTLDDTPGRGSKPRFSPSGRSGGQSDRM
jgi:hypothetical protein